MRTPEHSPDSSQKRKVRSSNVSPQSIRFPLKLDEVATFQHPTLLAAIEEDDEMSEAVDHSLTSESEISGITDESADSEWNGEQRAEWEGVLQEHAVKLEKRAAYERRLREAASRGIPRLR